MVAVDGFSFFLVKTGRVRVHRADVECRDQLLEAEHVAIGANGPAQESEVVQQALFDEAALAVHEKI